MLDFCKANQWKIIKTDFDPSALGKVEANFCLGNSYLGLRSAMEGTVPGRDPRSAGGGNL